VRIVSGPNCAGGGRAEVESTLLTSPQACKAKAASIGRRTVRPVFRGKACWRIRRPKQEFNKLDSAMLTRFCYVRIEFIARVVRTLGSEADRDVLIVTR
jgi:hypothetical protein